MSRPRYQNEKCVAGQYRRGSTGHRTGVEPGALRRSVAWLFLLWVACAPWLLAEGRADSAISAPASGAGVGLLQQEREDQRIGGSLNATPISAGPGTPTIVIDQSVVVGATGDPTNPGALLTVSDPDGPVEELVITVASTNDNVLPAANVAIEGIGEERAIGFEPVGRGTSSVTFTATDADDNSAAITMSYAASVTAPDPSGRYHHHISDASSALDVGDSLMLLINDETNTIFLHSQDISGPPPTTWTFTPDELGTDDEIDFESMARSGELLVISGSHGNSRSGSARPERRTFVGATITGTGADTELAFLGRYNGLWEDLRTWDAEDGHGLGPDFLGFVAGTAPDVEPNPPDGFNIEALEFAPDGEALYLGFRAPTIEVDGAFSALIVPLLNVDDIVDGVPAPGPALFGDPILLELDGRSVRALRRNEQDEYLISAGPSPQNDTWALYTWDGDPEHSPQLNRLLPDPDLLTGGTWESIAYVPHPLVADAEMRLVADSGDTNYYGTGANKDLPQPFQKSYSQLFVLYGPARDLTVSIEGGGEGTVSGDGIACPGDCEETFTEGTEVTLSAVAEPGFVFTGWGGDCAGTDDCLLTLDADKAVTATFVVVGPAPEIGMDPESLSSVLQSGQMETQNLTISNLGEETLEWEVTEEAGLSGKPFASGSSTRFGARSSISSAEASAVAAKRRLGTVTDSAIGVGRGEGEARSWTDPGLMPGGPDRAVSNDFVSVGSLTFYDDRGDFQASNPGLPLEDFSDTNAPPNDVTRCPPPFNSDTDNSCFSPGDIEPGLSMDVTIDGDGDGDAAILTPPFAGVSCVSVGPSTFDSHADWDFDPPVPAVGFDLQAGGTSDRLFTVTIFGPGGELGSTDVTGGFLGAPVFFGVDTADGQGISRIEVRNAEPQLELFCNVEFGAVDCTLPDWVSVAPTSGAVEPGLEQVAEVTFDATGQEPGELSADLCLASNDPFRPLVVVPLSLTVEEPAPIIDVDPDSLSSNLEQGTMDTQDLAISNVGEEPLDWEVTEVDELAAGIRGSVVRVARRSAAAGTHTDANRASGRSAVAPGPVADASGGRAAVDVATALGGRLPSLQVINPTRGGIDCDAEPGIIIHDDGTVENGYSGNPTAGVTEVRFVDLFTPSSFPVTFESVCVAYVTGGPPTLDFDIVVFDDDGAGGSPGTELGSMAFTATEIPVFPNETPAWGSFDISSLGITVTEGSVYIGVRYMPPGLPNVFIASDQSTGNPVGFAGGFWWNNNDGVWIPIEDPDNGFPEYRSLMVRAVEVPPVDCTLPDWVSVDTLSGSIAPDMSQVVGVTFDATGQEPGELSANLCLASNDPELPLLSVPLALTVVPPAPELAFAPPSLDFGPVEVGETSPALPVTLTNSGSLDVTGLTFDLSAPAFAADPGTCGATLPAGASCDFSVTFTPAEPGPAAATLRVTSAEEASAELPLAGNGTGEPAFTPVALTVDPEEKVSDGNGVFEPHELIDVMPSWRNDGNVAASLTGTASQFTGPDGADYELGDEAADYGLVEAGATASCEEVGLCYRLGVNGPAVRPATHWMATFDETLSDDTAKTWALHIGDSFADVPRESLLYVAIETLLHGGVASGCGGSEYCPQGVNTRSQMAVFLLKAVEGGDYLPPACEEGEERFLDVAADNLFCSWIEELAAREITTGCGGDNFCPGDSVTRAQMAVFLLKAALGSGYTPPACTEEFADVPCSSIFAAWIEDLAERGITSGCGGDNYCPADAVTRAQMAVFVTKAFGLTLYGP